MASKIEVREWYCHAERVKEWEGQKTGQADIEPKGNAMTQEFYIYYNVIIHHVNFIKEAERWINHCIIFQEDGNPSHGMRSTNNPPAKLKNDSVIKNLSTLRSHQILIV